MYRFSFVVFKGQLLTTGLATKAMTSGTSQLWKMREHCFARELTAEETVLFCKLSRTSLHQ